MCVCVCVCVCVHVIIHRLSLVQESTDTYTYDINNCIEYNYVCLDKSSCGWLSSLATNQDATWPNTLTISCSLNIPCKVGANTFCDSPDTTKFFLVGELGGQIFLPNWKWLHNPCFASLTVMACMLVPARVQPANAPCLAEYE